MSIIIACGIVLRRINTLRCTCIATFPLNRLANVNYQLGLRSIATDGKITIDGITKSLKKPKNPFFVPQKFCKYIAAIIINFDYDKSAVQ